MSSPVLKYFALLLPILITACSTNPITSSKGVSQNRVAASNLVEWPGPLNWSNYHMKAPSNDLDAATHIVVETPWFDGTNHHWTARAFMMPDSSWTRAEDNLLLAHEQLHFDLAEMYVREYRKRMEAIPANQQKARAYATYQQVMQEMFDAQDRYDNETGHGIDLSRQHEWANRIKEGVQVRRAFAMR